MYGGSATYRTHLSYEGPRTPGYDLFEDFYDPESMLLFNYSFKFLQNIFNDTYIV